MDWYGNEGDGGAPLPVPIMRDLRIYIRCDEGEAVDACWSAVYLAVDGLMASRETARRPADRLP